MHQVGWDQGTTDDMNPAMGSHDVRHNDACFWAASRDYKIAIRPLVDLHAHSQLLCHQ